MSEREFLFEYRFDGAVYGLPVVAKDIETARRKVSAMALAIYQGEIYATIPASPRSIWKWLADPIVTCLSGCHTQAENDPTSCVSMANYL